MIPHVMPVEWVLSHRVKEGNLLVLLLSKASNRVVTQLVLELHFSEDVLGEFFLITIDIFNLRLIIQPTWLPSVE